VDFKEAAKLGSCLSKDYAEDLFRLLATYKSISASEAASRLGLHIKTVQDFFEDLYSLGIIGREEVYEGKRPYFRYWPEENRITITIDLTSFSKSDEPVDSRLAKQIREKKNAGVKFTTSRNNDHISSVTIWIGDGRNRTERKSNLSVPQGKFLFHLPFPNAGFLSIQEIMKRARTSSENIPEILDIVSALIELGVIETN
jgi:predicted transcriptional regulator